MALETKLTERAPLLHLPMETDALTVFVSSMTTGQDRKRADITCPVLVVLGGGAIFNLSYF